MSTWMRDTSGTGPLPVRFMGTVNEPATVTVNGQDAKMTQLPGTTTGEKIFTATVDLPLGNNTVQVVATDLSTTPNTTTHTYALQVAGGSAKSFTYDDNGNCRTAGTTTYTWDAEDRLVLIERAGNLTTEISYDGFGRRTRIVEKNNGAVTSNKTFLWCGLELAEERNASGATVTKRFYPEGEQINGTACWFFRDHLGSVRQMVHSLITSYDYDPYGRRTKQVGSLEADFGFTGHYVHAPTGLHLAPFRAYDANIGRWLSRDPIGEAGGINLYGYVGNSPVDRRDALGLYVQFSTTAGMTWVIADTYSDLIENLQRTIARGEQISELKLSGHGDPDSISLDSYGNNTITANDSSILTGNGDDITDLLRRVLTKNAKVYLNGCDTANGNDNLARRMSRLLPGRTVAGQSKKSLGLTGNLGYNIGGERYEFDLGGLDSITGGRVVGRKQYYRDGNPVGKGWLWKGL